MIALWNTIYMEAALNQLRLEGHEVREADVARLSPLIHDHINMLALFIRSAGNSSPRKNLTARGEKNCSRHT